MIAVDAAVCERFLVTWCHGAPGIALARLGSLSIYQTDEILQDVEVALQTTQKYGLQGVDHLCCGNRSSTNGVLSLPCRNRLLRL